MYIHMYYSPRSHQTVSRALFAVPVAAPSEDPSGNPPRENRPPSPQKAPGRPIQKTSRRIQLASPVPSLLGPAPP